MGQDRPYLPEALAWQRLLWQRWAGYSNQHSTSLHGNRQEADHAPLPYPSTLW